MPKSEQTSTPEPKVEAEKPEFNKLSLEEMEKDLEKQKETAQTEVKEQDSVKSEEDSETEEKSEQPKSEEIDSEESEEVESKSKEGDNQPKKSKAHRELEAEFTRRSQKLKELETELAELRNKVQSKPEQNEEAEKIKKDVLAQLKEENPKAAQFIDALGEAINQRIDDRLKAKVDPLEERVTLRTRKENQAKFSQDIETFKKSDLADLEPEVMQVFNTEPAFWQQLIFESPDAFQQLLDTAVTKNLEKVVELKSKARRNKADSTQASKKKEIEKSKVARPSGKSKEISTKEFKELSLDDMEKALPRAD